MNDYRLLSTGQEFGRILFFVCCNGPEKDGLSSKYWIWYMTRSSGVMRYLSTDLLVILYSEKQIEGHLE